MAFADKTISENKRDWSKLAAINLEVSLFTHPLSASFSNGCTQYIDLGNEILDAQSVLVVFFCVISFTSIL